MLTTTTFVMIKPDGVRNGLIGKIISRIEDKGLDIIYIDFGIPNEMMVDDLYAEHLGKEFYNRNKTHIMSGNIVRMLVQGEDVIHVMRTLVGDAMCPKPGTIRGDYATSVTHNVVHASADEAAALIEINLVDIYK